MFKISETIIVEGIYDKIKLSQFIDGVIFVTNGFTVFRNEDMQKAIKALGEKTGIVILTDSDAAGFKIRNYVKLLLPEDKVKHAYIPDIYGKERRKRVAGKEGLLGVEGIDEDIIIEALKNSGCEIDGACHMAKPGKKITKAHMYALGLSGKDNSRKLRQRLTNSIGLPYKVSSNMLLDVINRLFSYDEFCELVQNLEEKID